ncbi:8-amino-7-oxononanoate synthase [Thermogemmatispora sp.]|jgi:8-amino-7-oxononanoate synthase|uniref:8-amino-7-oxononanoate synthase n=1 Tax=Thermogemmatispora sp. TaxID=1968838 RepID=UPI002580DC21|nr:8-amino-7-oxononanoate synthase [Thermogemmatispora sp.]
MMQEGRPLDFMRERLEALREAQLYRRLRPELGSSEPWLECNGHRLLNLSSNNYLGLATHPALKTAAKQASERYGCGAGSSRLIAGSSDLHAELERRLARFKRSESALLFNSGYVANVGVITALVGPGDLILSDALNHASIIDGCRLSRATCKVYPHNDSDTVAQLLAEAYRSGQYRRILVVTDSVFSMDGDVAPLEDLIALCRQYGALLLVDEAHATGCLGPGGRGLLAAVASDYEGIIAVGTLSKALGGFGAFVAGPTLLIDYLINVARPFIFTTALPPPVIAASLAALTLLEEQPTLVERLQANAAYLRRGLQDLGYDTLTSRTHIVPVLVGDAGLALKMAARLQDYGVLAVAIRPPTVPAGMARIRASVMAVHERSDLDFAIEAFERVGGELKLLR